MKTEVKTLKPGDVVQIAGVARTVSAVNAAGDVAVILWTNGGFRVVRARLTVEVLG